jgi:hypothetical protein
VTSCARSGVGSGTNKRQLPSLARRPASHSATARQRGGDTARRSRMTATLARRPGATGVRDEGAVTYGLRDQKMKAAVKKGSTREGDVGGTSRGSRGGAASRCGLLGWPLTPAAAWASLPRLTPPSPLLPPFFSSFGAWWRGWDETPRWLGLGAHGGAVAAYLYRRAVRRYVDGRDAQNGRRAHCDSGHDRRGRALAPTSTKAVKRKVMTAMPR